MTPARDTAALVLAAGAGERLGLGPKALLRLGRRTLVGRLVETLRPLVGRVYVALPRDRVGRVRFGPGTTTIAGGATRQETVRLLVEASRGPWLLVADASRPFASADLASRILRAARRTGAAVPYTVPPVPGLRIAQGRVRETLAQGTYALPQSPQAYRRDVLERAYALAARYRWRLQTTHELVLRAGFRPAAVPGEESNLKLTTPLDWEIARRVLAGRRKET